MLRRTTMKKSSKPSQTVLKLPYARVLIPDAETGTYTAELPEFPGCVAQGASPEEAYARLEEAARSWIEAAEEMGQAIPEPAAANEYSGRFALRLPRSLHRQASQLAQRDGASLNQFIVTALAEKVGATVLYRGLELRLMTAVTRALQSSSFRQHAATPPESVIIPTTPRSIGMN
jgi:predicted RNase H-like HicB family nuclease